MRCKGQMFLITSIIIIVTLILLKTTINLPEIIQGETETESKFEQQFFENTANELVKTIEISYYQPNNITNNIFDFGNFTRKKLSGHLLNFKFLYVGSITPRTTGTDSMNITVLNLLGKTINATLQLNSSTPTNFSEMVDKSRWDISYSINQGLNYILTIGYNNTYEESIIIETKPQQSVYTAFFDVTLENPEIMYKDKFQKSYTLPQ